MKFNLMNLFLQTFVWTCLGHSIALANSWRFHCCFNLDLDLDLELS